MRLARTLLGTCQSEEYIMTRLSRYAAIAATVVASALASSALANVITFETAPLGDGFTGPVTENGFTYSRLSGLLSVRSLGNPGQDMEAGVPGGPTGGPGGGVLKIVSATGGNFNFDDIDFAAFFQFGVGMQTLSVEGFLGASTVGMDTYTLPNTSNVPYTNWTTELASTLAGKTLSELDIPLNGGGSPGTASLEAIDNVVLTPLEMPEPASLALLASGLLGLGWMRRRKT